MFYNIFDVVEDADGEANAGEASPRSTLCSPVLMEHIFFNLCYKDSPVGPLAAANFGLFLERSSFTCLPFLPFKAFSGQKSHQTFERVSPNEPRERPETEVPITFLKKGLGTAISGQFWLVSIGRERTEKGQISNISMLACFTRKLGKKKTKKWKNLQRQMAPQPKIRIVDALQVVWHISFHQKFVVPLSEGSSHLAHRNGVFVFTSRC